VLPEEALPVWIPRNEQEIESAAANRSLEETVTFDAKREIPSKNFETAKDVSALANTAGGVLLYGIGEDQHGRLTVLNPLTLQGQRERIEQIIRTSVDEIPNFTFFSIETKSDSSRGYLVVLVPPSERAPHMVVVRGERRFYGRGETGNYVLSQVEVARLYERRRAAESDILPGLEKLILSAPLKTGGQFAHLHLVAKPVLHNDNILDRALLTEGTHSSLLRLLMEKMLNAGLFRNSYIPDLGHPPKGWKRQPEGYVGRIDYRSELDALSEGHMVQIQINLDGSAYLFCGRAGENQRDGHPPKWFFSGIVAGCITKMLLLLEQLYSRASYFGMVDVAVALTDIENCVPFETKHRFHVLPRFEGSDYKKATRVAASLLLDDPKQPAAALLMPLVDSISQGTDHPFDK
jgi:hypothetical protein